MPGTTLGPNQASGSASHLARTERFERQTNKNIGSSKPGLVFSYPGSIVNNTESPRFYAMKPVVYSSARLSLLTASTADLSVGVYKNGTLVQTLTLTAGQTTTLVAITMNQTVADYVTVKVTSVGTASNASVQIA